MAKGLLIGGPVWGEDYADIFERYCLATMRSPANLAALQANDASLEIYTDTPTWDRVHGILEHCGLPHEVKLIPWVEGDSKYDTLSKIHAQQVSACVEADRPFHMLVCDQMYSQNYFPRLFDLAAKHGNLVHSGINCRMEGAGVVFDSLRNPDGSLSISSDQLGHISWEHRHNRLSQFVMNDGEWPNFHMHLWRARDRAMIFCAHNSPIYLTPETGKNLGKARSTLDSLAHLIGEYHAPSLEDDMTLSGVDTGKVQAYPRVDWHQFAINCWDQAKSAKSIGRYYRRPTAEVALPIDESAPTAEDVLVRQIDIANRLIDYGAELGWPPVTAEHRVAANA